MTAKNRLVSTIGSNTDELIELVEQLVETPTVTGNEKPGQEVIINYLESMGLAPDVWLPDQSDLKHHDGYFETSVAEQVGYDDRPNVAVRIPGQGNGPTLTVGGHIDVVDVTDEEWDQDPWQLTRNQDILYGRGVADMKGGLAAALVAIKSILEVKIELDGDLIFQSTIGEEAGGTGGALSALERGYKPNAAVIAEPLTIPNIGIASAGVMYFKVDVPGESVHAAWGHKGDNAIGNATLVYKALDELDQQRKISIDYEPAYRADPSLEGNVTNLNIGQIEAGDWPSTVPATAKMYGRIGWPPGETRAEVRSQIEDAVASVTDHVDWEQDQAPSVEWFGWQAQPHEVDSEEEIAQLAKSIAEQVTGESGVFVGGNAALDERFYKRYYDIPAVSVGPEGHNLHGANEHTTVKSLVDTSQTLAQIIIEFCGFNDTAD